MKLHDYLVLAGAAITIAGIALFSWKSAVIVAGVLILWTGIRLSRDAAAAKAGN